MRAFLIESFSQFCGQQLKVFFVFNFKILKFFRDVNFWKFSAFSEMSSTWWRTACWLLSLHLREVKNNVLISIFRLQLQNNKVCDNDSESRFWRISLFWIKITAHCTSVTRPLGDLRGRTLAVRPERIPRARCLASPRNRSGRPDVIPLARNLFGPWFCDTNLLGFYSLNQ